MKHVKVLSKPVCAEETAWVQLKNVLNFFGPLRPLNLNTGNPAQSQANWVAEQWYNYLVK